MLSPGSSSWPGAVLPVVDTIRLCHRPHADENLCPRHLGRSCRPGTEEVRVTAVPVGAAKAKKGADRPSLGQFAALSVLLHVLVAVWFGSARGDGSRGALPPERANAFGRLTITLVPPASQPSPPAPLQPAPVDTQVSQQTSEPVARPSTSQAIIHLPPTKTLPDAPRVRPVERESLTPRPAVPAEREQALPAPPVFAASQP